MPLGINPFCQKVFLYGTKTMEVFQSFKLTRHAAMRTSMCFKIVCKACKL